MTNLSVLLVHGAWADGSSWSKVIPLLEGRGLFTRAVQLPLTSVQDDVAVVKRAIALADTPILLVGHSYGGVVITEAGVDPKVSGLVYIAAFAPDATESAGSLLGTVPPSPMSAERVGRSAEPIAITAARPIFGYRIIDVGQTSDTGSPQINNSFASGHKVDIFEVREH